MTTTKKGAKALLSKRHISRPIAEFDKPDLTNGAGGWIDPDYLPPTARARLAKIAMPSSLSADQIADLIDFTSTMLQSVEVTEDATAYADQRAQIDAIANAARRLLIEIASMSPEAIRALGAHSDYLIHGSKQPAHLPYRVKAQLSGSYESKFLGEAWDWAQAIGIAAEYASEQYKIDRQSKPEQLKVRGLVSLVARRYEELTGQLPPKSIDSWFGQFMQYVGTQFHLDIGARLIRSGIEQVRR